MHPDLAIFDDRFKQSETFGKISLDYDRLILDELEGPARIPGTFHGMYTPREHLAEPSTFSYLPFFYIEEILKTNPEVILDLGCGGNLFKKYIPQIFGMDPHNVSADAVGSLSPETIREYSDKFDAAIAINSIHFIPITAISTRLVEFSQLVKPNGLCYATFNMQMLRENTAQEMWFDLFGSKEPIFKIREYIINEFEKLPFTIVKMNVLDLGARIPRNSSEEDRIKSCNLNNIINGNIHILFKRELKKC